MFCRGNISEKLRIAKFDCRGKVVVDLFAGIGYFVLPYLVHAKVGNVSKTKFLGQGYIFFQKIVFPP